MLDQDTKRYVVLDGMRGVAALCVAVLHASQLLKLGYKPFHASLAVDFFFCLSGFVVAFAYDRKLPGMSIQRFFAVRLIRLYPMIALGIALGAGVLLLALLRGDLAWKQTLVLIGSAFVLLPAGLKYQFQAYPVNNPIWSLFFELCANAAYGLHTKYGQRLKPGAVTAVVGALGVALAGAVLLQHGVDPIGFDGPRNFVLGFVRVAFPFVVGMCICRSGIHRRLPQVHWMLPMLVLLAILMCPWWRHEPVFDLVCLLVLLPLIVALGAAAEVQPHGVILRGLEWLGAMSYPFYLLHEPLLRLARDLNITDMPSLWVAVLAFLLAGVLAQLALSLYDEPLRASLMRRLRRAPPAIGVPARA
ncbi:acyltransferase [Roseateles sp. SL47]|uniref:acyltransferase family protein n=1 Tax=Roseateles sp. SL47 TaxID=2995138 RepID=UPI00226D76DC|nr:acyltransferase [Roseateles sp. SL47]WAC71999.1 acyltransferase [Roseateles sp. SL47]